MTEYDDGSGAQGQLQLGLRTWGEEAAGWNAIVRPGLSHREFALCNESRLLTLTLPQFADFDLTAPEFLSLTVPPEAVTSGQRVVAS